MEFMSIPGSKGRGRRLLFSTDVSYMHVGTALDQQSRAFPCLTVHYVDERQLQMIWAVARQIQQAGLTPQVYLNRLPGHADIIFVLRFPFQGAVAGLIRGISSGIAALLGGECAATEVVLLGAAEFGYGPGETGMGLNEFLAFLRETKFFLLGFCNTEDPNLSPHPPEISIKSFTPGNPLPELMAQ